jgi:NADH:ubiquinone oxidoreductase subunit E
LFDKLRVIQQEFGYLPAEQLQRLAGRISVPLSQIHAVASFYPHFQLTPPPQADVRVCADMSCHLRGSGEVKASLEQAFRGSNAEAVAIRDVSCLGRCDQAPAVSINDHIYCPVRGDRATAMV